MTEIPYTTPERHQSVDDNARKFLVEPLDDDFLTDHSATSFELTVHWIETNQSSEKKLAHKKFADGSIETLIISKSGPVGSIKTTKEPILDDERYRQLIPDPALHHLKKTRYEFQLLQNGVAYSAKYDVFDGDKLYMLEVDATDEAARAAFDPSQLPGSSVEVTGDLAYYGYRVCSVL